MCSMGKGYSLLLLHCIWTNKYILQFTNAIFYLLACFLPAIYQRCGTAEFIAATVAIAAYGGKNCHKLVASLPIPFEISFIVFAEQIYRGGHRDGHFHFL